MKRLQALAEAAALRKRWGVALRRRPGRLPRHEGKAFARVVRESELKPWELVDELLSVLLERYPEVSIVEAARWLTAPDAEGDHYGTAASQLAETPALAWNEADRRVDSDRGAIIESDPGAPPSARGPAEGKAST